jgi:hypothetical protein
MADLITIIKLLFGELGVVGAVCFIGAGHISWLLHQERLAHEQTRATIKEVVRDQALANMKFVELLTEIRTYLEARRRMEDEVPRPNRAQRRAKARTAEVRVRSEGVE